MISWLRTYNAQIGKANTLLKLTKEAAKHLKKAHGLKCDMYMQVGGDPSRFGLVGQYKNMASVGKLEAKIAKDKKWADIMKRARGLVVEGSVKDEFWKKI